jgi:hypothetical protein
MYYIRFTLPKNFTKSVGSCQEVVRKSLGSLFSIVT